MIGDRPDAVVSEHELPLFALEVVAVDRVRVRLDVVGAIINVARVVARELVEGLHLRLVHDDGQRAAFGIEQVDAGVLFTFAIARQDEVLAVRRDVRERGRVLASGDLDRKALRTVEAPDLPGAGDRPREEHPLAVGRDGACARRAHVEHHLNAPGDVRVEARRCVLRENFGRHGRSAVPGVCGRRWGGARRRRGRWSGRRGGNERGRRRSGERGGRPASCREKDPAGQDREAHALGPTMPAARPKRSAGPHRHVARLATSVAPEATKFDPRSV